MTYHFRGTARPMTPGAFTRAAMQLGCQEAALRAVWKVEGAGKGFRSDGSLLRRFEPHHMPRSRMTWRDSLKLSGSEREAMFAHAWDEDAEAAARASSWGGPQIMGFHAKLLGYSSAIAMVSAMADREDEHLAAFVAFVSANNLDTALRARDWLAFATGYNGTGQPEVYARRMEAEYKASTGQGSPVVLRIGARGASVRRLQEALGIKVDGSFGPQTRDAVVAYQKLMGLAPDGVVGAMTWEVLRADREARPIEQSTNPFAPLFEAILTILRGLNT